jgi:phosphatidylglycerophosphate synthase
MAEQSNRTNLIIVQAITLSRAIIAISFITIALIPSYKNVAVMLFVLGGCTDLIDGYLARRLSVVTKTGGIFDLFSDKYFTIICIAYAVARNAPILPCAIAIFREVFLLSVRSITVEGEQIFPPQRRLGGLTIFPIWMATLILLLYPEHISFPWWIFQLFYWIIGVICLCNLIYKIKSNWKELLESFKY